MSIVLFIRVISMYIYNMNAKMQICNKKMQQCQNVKIPQCKKERKCYTAKYNNAAKQQCEKQRSINATMQNVTMQQCEQNMKGEKMQECKM